MKNKVWSVLILTALLVSCGDGSNISLDNQNNDKLVLPNIMGARDIVNRDITSNKKEKSTEPVTFVNNPQIVRWVYYTDDLLTYHTDNTVERWYISRVGETVKQGIYSLMAIKPDGRNGWGQVAGLAENGLVPDRVPIGANINLTYQTVVVDSNLDNDQSNQYYDVGWNEFVTDSNLLLQIRNDRRWIQGQTVPVKWYFFPADDGRWYIINAPRYDGISDGYATQFQTEHGDGLHIMKFGAKDGQYDWTWMWTRNLIVSFYNATENGQSLKKFDLSTIGDRFTDNPAISSGNEIDVKKDKVEIQTINDPRQWTKGANLLTLKQEMKDTISTIVKIWGENGLGIPVITSGNDAFHRGPKKDKVICLEIDGVNSCRAKSKSRHYTDLAIDLQTKYFGSVSRQDITNKLQIDLGEKYCVILEYKGEDREHIHVQFGREGICPEEELEFTIFDGLA